MWKSLIYQVWDGTNKNSISSPLLFKKSEDVNWRLLNLFEEIYIYTIIYSMIYWSSYNQISFNCDYVMPFTESKIKSISLLEKKGKHNLLRGMESKIISMIAYLLRLCKWAFTCIMYVYLSLEVYSHALHFNIQCYRKCTIIKTKLSLI